MGTRWFVVASALLSPLPVQAAERPAALNGHGGPVRGVAVATDGERALSASFDYSAMLWNMRTGAPAQRLLGHDAAVNDVAFVPERDMAVSVSDDGSTVVWDLATGDIVHRFSDAPDKVVDVDVSRDGRYAATARWDGTARLFDLSSMEEVARLEGHRGPVNGVAFLERGTVLATGSQDGSLRLWSVPDGEALTPLVREGWGINVVRALPDGTLAFGTQRGTIARVDRQGNLSEIGSGERPIMAMDVAGAGKEARLAVGSGDGRIQVFGGSDWTLLEAFENPKGPVWGLSFADAAGDALYYSGLDDEVFLWQVAPRAEFEDAPGDFPRRFQKTAEMSLGERQFQRKCSVCHTLDPDDRNRAGPSLFGVFGRRAGSLPDYSYSKGLSESGIVWTEETIALLFDHGPDVVTPGSKMPIQRIVDAGKRDALVAFLKEATSPDEGAGQGRGRN